MRLAPQSLSPLLLLLLLLLLAVLSPSAHAWRSVRAANRSDESPSPPATNRSAASDPDPATELTGSQSVSIRVGCESSMTYPTEAALDPARARFTYVVEHPVAEFISLHFAHFNLPPGDFVVVRPTGGGEKQALRYGGNDSETHFFTRALYTKSVTLELFTDPNASANGSDAAPRFADACRGFVVDEYRFLAAPASFSESSAEALCGADDSDEASCFQGFPTAYRQSRAVARLLIHKNKKSFFCTGWLVGCEGHVLTNHHCVSEPLHAENTEFEFMAQGNACAVNCKKGFACKGRTRATRATLVVANKNLDYALLKLDENLAGDYGYLQMRESGAKMKERLYIPQHPSGWGKRIAMKDGDKWGKVTSLTRGGCLPNQVAYSLDTQGGSSGSPVLAWKDNAVVALHHCGGCPNTAVNTKFIVADLRARGLLPLCAVADATNGDDGGDDDDDEDSDS